MARSSFIAYNATNSKAGITAATMASDAELMSADDAGFEVSENGDFVGAGGTRYVGGAFVAQLLPN